VILPLIDLMHILNIFNLNDHSGCSIRSVVPPFPSPERAKFDWWLRIRQGKVRLRRFSSSTQP